MMIIGGLEMKNDNMQLIVAAMADALEQMLADQVDDEG
ncbi:hypothetical protein IMAU80119_00415 [Lactiplantibacillus plantarum]|nr:hypothetical protein [Lactiplantibacillus plantarum]